MLREVRSAFSAIVGLLVLVGVLVTAAPLSAETAVSTEKVLLVTRSASDLQSFAALSAAADGGPQALVEAFRGVELLGPLFPRDMQLRSLTVRSAVSPSPSTDRLLVLRSTGRRAISEYRELMYALALMPGVERVEPNYVFGVSQVASDDFFFSSSRSWGQPYEDLWGLHRVMAPVAWERSKGEDILVAVVDTGVDYNHPDLKENMWVNPGEVPGNKIDDDKNGLVDDVYGADFTECAELDGYFGCAKPKPVSGDPVDRHGHGTHVAGIIAARDGNGLGMAGVAPRAKIMAVKVLGDDGFGTADQIMRGVRYAVQHGAQVINLSLGGPDTPFQSYREVIEAATREGVLVVAAAGNDARDVSNFTPANIPSVITVASTNVDDEQSSFSNFGYEDAAAGGLSLIDLAAPGGGRNRQVLTGAFRPDIDILSLRASGTDMYLGSPGYPAGDLVVRDENGTEYYRSIGTSMAAPFVSGAAAVLLRDLLNRAGSQPPSRARLAEEVLSRLRLGADPFATSPVDARGRAVSLGAGRLNVQESLLAKSRPFLSLKPLSVREIQGDFDGLPRPGEVFALSVELQNAVADVTSLKLSLDVRPELPVSVENPVREFGNIAAGAAVSNADAPFLLQVTRLLRFAQVVPLQAKIEVRSDSGVQIQTLAVPLVLGAATLTTTHVENRLTEQPEFMPPDRPSMNDRYVVWTDTRNGNLDIFAFDLVSGEESLVSSDGTLPVSHPANQSHPTLSGTRVIWQDDRSGVWTLWERDLATRSAPLPVALPALPKGFGTVQPQLDGDRLVFTLLRDVGAEKPDLDAYYVNLLTQEAIRLGRESGDQFNPTVSGDRVAWEEGATMEVLYRPSARDAGREVSVAPKGVWGLTPKISGDRIALTVATGTKTDVIVAEVDPRSLTVTHARVTDDAAAQSHPFLQRTNLLWSDQSEGNFEIAFRDMARAANRIERVSLSSHDDILPVASEKFIAWLRDTELLVTPIDPEVTTLPKKMPPATPTPLPTVAPTAVPRTEPGLTLGVRLQPRVGIVRLSVARLPAFPAGLDLSQCQLVLRSHVTKPRAAVVTAEVARRSLTAVPSNLTLKAPSLGKPKRKASAAARVQLSADLECGGALSAFSNPTAVKRQKGGVPDERKWLKKIKGALAKAKVS